MPNPAELIGKWELIDVRGDGSLGEVMQNKPSDYIGISGGMVSFFLFLLFFNFLLQIEVELKENGILSLNVDTGVGKGWRFKPGPAHLDTCEFIIQSSVDNDLILKYIGYIDRGQRVESRYSLLR